MSSLPPHDLVAGIRSRDPHVLSWVYDTYGPRLFHYLLRRLGDPDLARDASHDVFVRFLERADTFEDRGVPLIAWLFRLARNLAIDVRRRCGRTIPFSAMALADYSADDGQSHLTPVSYTHLTLPTTERV